MKVSYNWLKQYVDLEGITPEDLAERLTRSGIEVESVEARNKGVSKVVIGHVVERSKHPDADKLNVCQVDVGETVRLQIVCGAANVDAGQKVVVSVVGAELPGGLKIKKAKLRGVESQGMICSAKELGLNDKLLPKAQQEGIMVLPEETEVGQDAITYLGLDDYILELGLTPNRSDCLSMLGVAYEVGAILDRPVQLPDAVVEEAAESINGKVEVSIEAAEHCTHYATRLISNIKLGSSPLWMQSRLMAAGIRPISNIVDITNYVMLEMGQPLHAFDYDEVHQGRIVVRLAKDGEKLTTLDDIERTLDGEMLLITDELKPIGIAGVMGGANSEVSDKTTTILLESALFSGKSIRKTAKKLGLRSEASLRFEKEVDPEAVDRALDRAAQLMVELAGGTVAQGKAVDMTSEHKRAQVSLRLSRLNLLLGTTLEAEQVEAILGRLQFRYTRNGEVFEVEVPSRRQDITREVDLVEEVARLHGYDHIPTTLPIGPTTRGGLTDYQSFQRNLRNMLTGAGLYEVSTYSFTNEQIMYDFATLYKETKGIPLSMPMSEERSHLRVNLLPHMLETASYNRNRQNLDVAIFEMGRVFISEEERLTVLPEEKLGLAGLLTGNWTGDHWNSSAEKADFYLVKGVVELVLDNLGIQQVSYRQAENLKGMHPGRTAGLYVQDECVGYLGQVHPELQKKYDLDETFVFQIDLEKLYSYVATMNQYKFLPKYPASTRDLSIVVEEGTSAAALQQVIEEQAGAILEKVELFDVYTGEKIGAGKKSMAFSLVYRSAETTLTDQEVNEAHDRVVQGLAKAYKAELRG
ncbi:phenylalanine--tRNA ligase subunit beta [Ammoniphilus sp. CFH 90114]|uniref:phenylalanine--tRNA ligase subunit beta n=1 Tax=Ammoniphilus sp. CFH 90114 TaxID=2493665 RepID=UPI00100E2B86|nr:phenylalanine--tRNA ligase subunit beta [Ammoniphilus sp. CFH 90114]RXT04743.1 phenylalanine--tRNA ligase subunit beta [Ammoniphilus sp. CFH 90114]